jgi:hypothetical protein
MIHGRVPRARSLAGWHQALAGWHQALAGWHQVRWRVDSESGGFSGLEANAFPPRA